MTQAREFIKFKLAQHEGAGQLLNSKSRIAHSESERLQITIGENNEKITNLVSAIEKSGGSESLYARLKEVEEEQNLLYARLKSSGTGPAQSIVLSDVKKMVEQFVQNFECEFDTAPIEGRKELVKKVISEIVVDREKNVIKFYVRRIPSISQIIDDVLKIKEPTTNVVSSSSSGGRT